MGDMMHDTAEQEEKIILVGVATAENDDTEQSLDELEELGQTAGAVTLAKSDPEPRKGPFSNLYWKRKDTGSKRVS